jgi:hypothetical protein
VCYGGPVLIVAYFYVAPHYTFLHIQYAVLDRSSVLSSLYRTTILPQYAHHHEVHLHLLFTSRAALISNGALYAFPEHVVVESIIGAYDVTVKLVDSKLSAVVP